MNFPSLNLFLAPPTDWWRWLPDIALLVVYLGSTLQAVLADESPLEITDPRHNHWSFQLAQRLELPAAERTDWPRNPIDYYVLAKQEAQGLLPSPEANRTTLL